MGEKKKKLGSDLLESREAEGVPVDFISSLKSGVKITECAPSIFHNAFMSEPSQNWTAQRIQNRDCSPYAPASRVEIRRHLQVPVYANAFLLVSISTQRRQSLDHKNSWMFLYNLLTRITAPQSRTVHIDTGRMAR